MATISENLQTLQTAKQNIKSAIEAKGQDLSNVPFTQYADKISAIETGGGSASATLTPEMIAGIWKGVIGDESQIALLAYYVFSLKENENGEKLMKMFSIDDYESGTFTELPYTISGNNVILDENGDEPLEFTYSFEDGKMTLNSESFPVPLTKIITGMGENEDNINPLADITENGLYTPKTLNDTELLFFGANVNVPTSSGGTDRLQWKCDNMKSLAYEFQGYTGSDLSMLEGLDTSQVTDMRYAFTNAKSITTFPTLDASGTTNLSYAFSGCSELTEVPLKNTSNVQNWEYAFGACKKLVSVENLDFSGATTMTRAFTSCLVQNVPVFNIPNCTSLNNTFYYAESIPSITLNTTNKLTTLDSTFRYARAFTDISISDTSGVTTFYYTFQYCNKLENLSPIDASSAVTLYFAFTNCQKIKTITINNTNNVTSFYGTFNDCPALETIDGVLNMIKATTLQSIFANCKALKNVTLKNIKQNLQIGSGTTWGHLLTNASLLNTAQELWDNTDSALGGTRTLTMSATSKTNIQSIYVKLIDVTDEMIANDEYISNKKPCVECASTDEGAMTLEEYILSKGWAIA